MQSTHIFFVFSGSYHIMPIKESPFLSGMCLPRPSLYLFIFLHSVCHSPVVLKLVAFTTIPYLLPLIVDKWLVSNLCGILFPNVFFCSDCFSLGFFFFLTTQYTFSSPWMLMWLRILLRMLDFFLFFFFC